MNTQVEADERWRQEGLRWGIIAGGIIVALFAGVYFLNRPLVLSRGLWLGSLLIYALAMGQAQKTGDEGEDLKAYIQPGFLVFVVANALFYLYYYFLFAVFDPELVELQAELVRQSGEEPNSPVQTTIGNTFFSYVQSLILGFIMAAGIGFILSRRLPANN